MAWKREGESRGEKGREGEGPQGTCACTCTVCTCHAWEEGEGGRVKREGEV